MSDSRHNGSALIGYMLLCSRLILSVFWIIFIFFPLYIIWQLRAEKLNALMMQLSFYVGCLIWGVHVKVQGTLARERPLLMVSNHFSYLDVFALGGKIPARFTPKSEIASWPVIGFMCKITGCVFIDRRAAKTLHNKSALDYAMNQGSIISLFPEGTTNDGTALLPFKSSFFSLAEYKAVAVQPVSVVYTKLSGKKIDAGNRLLVGWYGDALFFPHVITFLQQRTVEVTLVFHDAVKGDAFESRKAIASYCRDVIEKEVASRSTE